MVFLSVSGFDTQGGARVAVHPDHLVADVGAFVDRPGEGDLHSHRARGGVGGELDAFGVHPGHGRGGGRVDVAESPNDEHVVISVVVVHVFGDGVNDVGDEDFCVWHATRLAREPSSCKADLPIIVMKSSGDVGASVNRSRLAGVLAVLAGVAVLVCAPTPATAQDPTVAPAGQLSADGRTVTAGSLSFSVSQSVGLSPEGQSVTVDGAGFNTDKGIYVALCAIPPTNHAPSPCGGGQDREGDAGTSTWISSNPPDYAIGLTTPYGSGGSFTATFSVSPMISATVDCRIVACAIVTRNDHTRSADRSQDLYIPVSFAAPSGAPTTAAPTTQPPASTTTAAPTSTTTLAPPPDGTVAEDGLAVSDGTRTLSSSAVDDLDPSGAEVEVTGTGYSDGTGVLVALCAVGEDDVLGPCTGGSANSSAWISSSPPDYGVDLAEPYGDGGSFSVDLEVPAVIDSETDCREVACALTTRPDDESPNDRSQELVLPVSFAAQAEASTTTEEQIENVAAGSEAVDDDSSSTPWIPIVVGIVAVGGVGFALRRRRVGPGSETK